MLNSALLGNRVQSRKIGCYIRVSTEEQAQNPEGSIRNQEERLKEIVKLKNTTARGPARTRTARSFKNSYRPSVTGKWIWYW
jgi:DNA invertase Pin-like site-specific DNA recombinase